MNQQEYIDTTRRDVFNTVINNIEYIKYLNIPFRITYVTKDNNTNKQDLRDIYNVEYIRLIPLHHRSYSNNNMDNNYCDYTKYGLFISSDGDVYPCVNDVDGRNNLGNDINNAIESKKFPYEMCKYCDMGIRRFPYPVEEYFNKVRNLSKEELSK